MVKLLRPNTKLINIFDEHFSLETDLVVCISVAVCKAGKVNVPFPFSHVQISLMDCQVNKIRNLWQVSCTLCTALITLETNSVVFISLP